MEKEQKNNLVSIEQKLPRQSFLNLNPKNAIEAMEVASFLARSNMVPTCYRGKPEDILVAMQLSVELGLNPMQGLQNIAVINGRPSLWGDGVLALVENSNKSQFINEYFEGDGDNLVAVCETQRIGKPKQIRKFSIDDAKRAGLWQESATVRRKGKDDKWYDAKNDSPWYKYPKRMLQMRARSWCLRDVYPDILNGISMVEEARDIIEGEVIKEKDVADQPQQTDSEKIKAAQDTMTAKPDSGVAERCEKAMEHYGFSQGKIAAYFDAFDDDKKLLDYFVSIKKKQMTLEALDKIFQEKLAHKNYQPATA